MVTADSVKAKLEGLISKANGVTGRADDTVTQAVDALIAGFGQGGQGLTVQTGSFIPAENLTGITLAVNGVCTNLVLWRVSQELPGDLRILQRFVGLDLTPAGGTACYHTLATNSAGTTLNASVYGDAPGAVFESGMITFSYTAASYGWGWMPAGDEYRWMAW